MQKDEPDWPDCPPAASVWQIPSGLLDLAEARARAGGVLALSGPPGIGKTQLGFDLALHLRRPDRRIEVLSLDDFYIPEHGRARDPMANHPLFRTRGVPGTHQLERLIACMASMSRGENTMVPRFDKLLDRPQPARRWRAGRPVQLFILEGWCLGAPAVADEDLAEPLNDLERNGDPDARWRRQVNHKLRYYEARMRPLIADLWFLLPPDWDHVRRWRREQEECLPGSGPRKDGAAVDEFLQHFERLARRMMEQPPAGALILPVDAERRLGQPYRREQNA